MKEWELRTWSLFSIKLYLLLLLSISNDFSDYCGFLSLTEGYQQFRPCIIVSLTSKHSLGPETRWLKTGWTLFFLWSLPSESAQHSWARGSASRSEHPFLGLGKGAGKCPYWDSVFLLWDFNTHVGNGTKTWRGVIGRKSLLDLNPSGVQLLDFCADCS